MLNWKGNSICLFLVVFLQGCQSIPDVFSKKQPIHKSMFQKSKYLILNLNVYENIFAENVFEINIADKTYQVSSEYVSALGNDCKKLIPANHLYTIAACKKQNGKKYARKIYFK